MDREELGGKGELEKGGEVKRSQEPGVRGVEEDKEGDGCFGGVPCKKKKKAKRVAACVQECSPRV